MTGTFKSGLLYTYVRMRRNLTISFDTEFIEQMDERRGAESRGRYIEHLIVEFLLHDIGLESKITNEESKND